MNGAPSPSHIWKMHCILDITEFGKVVSLVVFGSVMYLLKYITQGSVDIFYLCNVLLPIAFPVHHLTYIWKMQMRL